MEINKEELIKAMEEVLQQYLDGVHVNDFKKCPLCKLYYLKDSCSTCPMDVFRPNDTISCFGRLCYPKTQIYQDFNIIGKRHVDKIIEFYRQAIKAVKKLSPEELNKTDFIFLKDIDKKAYDIFKTK